LVVARQPREHPPDDQVRVNRGAWTLIGVGLYYPARRVPLIRLGQITPWSFVGTAAGLALMGGCCGILSLSK
jgi:hypothetical protein